MSIIKSIKLDSTKYNITKFSNKLLYTNKLAANTNIIDNISMPCFYNILSLI